MEQKIIDKMFEFQDRKNKEFKDSGKKDYDKPFYIPYGLAFLIEFCKENNLKINV